MLLAAWGWGLLFGDSHLGENDRVTQLTLLILGSSCFVGNLQAGSRGYRLAAALALGLALALAWQPVRALWAMY